MLDRITASSLRVGFETLRANPLRTLLSTLGIIMGVAALVSVLSLGDGMERYARDQISRTTDILSVSVSPSLFRTVDGQRFPRTDVVSLTREDAEAITSVVGTDGLVTMLVSGQALVTTRADTTPRVAQVVGTLAGVVSELPSPVAHGRFFTDDEVRADAPVAVISASLAERVAPGRARASIIGDTVLFQDSAREVIGVLAPVARGEPIAFMPVGVARTALPPALVGRPTTIVVKARRVEDVQPVRARVEGWLASRYGAAWQDRVTVATNQARVEQAEQGMLLFKLFMGALTGISLLVGGIGIMNVLLASVIERTREIGIRKAAGAQHRHILLQFLSESVTISGVGSMIGIALGVGAAFGVTAVMRRMATAQIYAGFSLGTFLVAVIASVLVGLTFGLYPALRAARLSPIEAMYHE
ncbi:MAG TPA: ABC transporter permease [Gemmatimonadaceae bacterium]|nr:ABC transporter permease [Gemmatimonadaceae bacterium]